jgi:hypothetical protein
MQEPPQNILDNFKVISDRLRELHDPNNNLTNEELLELVLKPTNIIPQTVPSKKPSSYISGILKKGSNSLRAAYHRPFANRVLHTYSGGKYTKKGKRKSNKRKSNKRKSNKRYSSLKL